MGLPVGCHLYAQELLDLLDGGTADNVRESGASLIVQIDKLGDAYVREVVGAQTKEPPLAVVDGTIVASVVRRLRQSELMAQILVF